MHHPTYEVYHIVTTCAFHEPSRFGQYSGRQDLVSFEVLEVRNLCRFCRKVMAAFRRSQHKSHRRNCWLLSFGGIQDCTLQVCDIEYLFPNSNSHRKVLCLTSKNSGRYYLELVILITGHHKAELSSHLLRREGDNEIWRDIILLCKHV